MDHELQRKIEVVYQEALKRDTVQQAIELLQHRLSPDRVFHSLEHTLEVIRDVIFLALSEEVAERELELLILAAAFHNTGYIQHIERPVDVSTGYAVAAMKETGYADDDIALVESLIRSCDLIESEDGRLYQPERGHLHAYLQDADLMYLGMKNGIFAHKRYLLFLELQLPQYELRSFMLLSLQFINDHAWKTKTAQRLREQARLDNISAAQAVMAAAP